HPDLHSFPTRRSSDLVATAFGCIDADESGHIRRFVEKPANPPGTPDDPETSYVSMGNYIFTTKVLIDAIRADADDEHSDHDMGRSEEHTSELQSRFDL